MVSKFGGRENLLISYIENFGFYEDHEWVDHPDPTLGRTESGEVEFSYCTGNTSLLKCGKGNYVFFHTTKDMPGERARFITAYFIVKDVGQAEKFARGTMSLGQPAIRAIGVIIIYC